MDTQNLIQIIVSALYYIILGVLVILSLFGIYLLIAHGRSRTLAVAVSLVYAGIFLVLFITTQTILHSLF
jgi:hypothetical protein